MTMKETNDVWEYSQNTNLSNLPIRLNLDQPSCLTTDLTPCKSDAGENGTPLGR